MGGGTRPGGTPRVRMLPPEVLDLNAKLQLARAPR
jgi:hypothetical protein